MSAFNFDDFVHEVGETIHRASDAKPLVDSVAEQLRRLLAGSFFLDEEQTVPARGVLTSRVLYRDTGNRFCVVACAWAPQQSTPIHDHATWGVIGGVRNRIVVTNYRRLDDQDIAGFADVSEVSRMLVSETSFAHVRSPDELIHKIENPFSEPAVTLHVFGDVDPWQNMYDPPAKTVTPFEPADNTVGI